MQKGEGRWGNLIFCSARIDFDVLPKWNVWDLDIYAKKEKTKDVGKSTLPMKINGRL